MSAQGPSSSHLSLVIASLQNYFHVYGIVGHGAYGYVLYVKHPSTKRGEALKVMFPDAGTKIIAQHALREMQAVALMNHPNVISSKGFLILNDGTVCMRMAPYSGTLRHLMNKAPHFLIPLSEVKYIFAQIVKGLAYAYETFGIVNRDLKPDNILIRDLNVVITDWGMSRMGFGLMYSTDQMYTPDVVSKWYAPAEALCGCGFYDSTVDVWSLGVILAELWAGECIFKTKPRRTSRKDFIVYSIFDVLGTPTRDEDIAFFESVCEIPLETVQRRPDCLEDAIGRAIPDEDLMFLRTLLQYSGRPSIADVLASPYVQSATVPDKGRFTGASDLFLVARNATAASYSGIDARLMQSIPTEPAKAAARNFVCWKATSITRDLIRRAWPLFRPEGATDTERAYAWLSAMVLSNVVLECFRGMSTDEVFIVAILTLCSSVMCSYGSRFEAAFVTELAPGITMSQLHAAETSLLKQCLCGIPPPPAWVQELRGNEAALFHACQLCVGDLDSLGVGSDELIAACFHPEGSDLFEKIDKSSP